PLCIPGARRPGSAPPRADECGAPVPVSRRRRDTAPHLRSRGAGGRDVSWQQVREVLWGCVAESAATDQGTGFGWGGCALHVPTEGVLVSDRGTREGGFLCFSWAASTRGGGGGCPADLAWVGEDAADDRYGCVGCSYFLPEQGKDWGRK
ncbi:MAG: hypothetical protein LWW98_06710, partial [Deltaproteobacteria bacterium]|nr:hypothetical protein [Deltaproteobacteria bacterium]